MKILCIIPAYNAALYIAATIRSIQSQTYKNVEIVVIDDKSTDNTFEVARSCGVKVIKNIENTGCYLALNVVLNSYHDFDAWYYHCADDISFENHFAELVAPLISNPRLMMTYCKYNRKDYYTGKLLGEFTGRRASMCLYRAEVFDRIGRYDSTRFGGDTEYWDRFLLYYKQNQIHHVNQCLANCMIHGQNLTIIHNGNARREYVEQFKARHSQLQASLNF